MKSRLVKFVNSKRARTVATRVSALALMFAFGYVLITFVFSLLTLADNGTPYEMLESRNTISAPMKLFAQSDARAKTLLTTADFSGGGAFSEADFRAMAVLDENSYNNAKITLDKNPQNVFRFDYGTISDVVFCAANGYDVSKTPRDLRTQSHLLANKNAEYFTRLYSADENVFYLRLYSAQISEQLSAEVTLKHVDGEFAHSALPDIFSAYGTHLISGIKYGKASELLAAVRLSDGEIDAAFEQIRLFLGGDTSADIQMVEAFDYILLTNGVESDGNSIGAAKTDLDTIVPASEIADLQVIPLALAIKDADIADSFYDGYIAQLNSMGIAVGYPRTPPRTPERQRHYEGLLLFKFLALGLTLALGIAAATFFGARVKNVVYFFCLVFYVGYAISHIIDAFKWPAYSPQYIKEWNRLNMLERVSPFTFGLIVPLALLRGKLQRVFESYFGIMGLIVGVANMIDVGETGSIVTNLEIIMHLFPFFISVYLISSRIVEIKIKTLFRCYGVYMSASALAMVLNMIFRLKLFDLAHYMFSYDNYSGLAREIYFVIIPIASYPLFVMFFAAAVFGVMMSLFLVYRCFFEVVLKPPHSKYLCEML